jgi:hypothetical protein
MFFINRSPENISKYEIFEGRQTHQRPYLRGANGFATLPSILERAKIEGRQSYWHLTWTKGRHSYWHPILYVIYVI